MNKGTCGSLTRRQLQTHDVEDTNIGLQLHASGVMGAWHYASGPVDSQTLQATQFCHMFDTEWAKECRQMHNTSARLPIAVQQLCVC